MEFKHDPVIMNQISRDESSGEDDMICYECGHFESVHDHDDGCEECDCEEFDITVGHHG